MDLKLQYCGMSYSGSSCEEICNNYPDTRDKSGYYLVNDEWYYYNMDQADTPCGGRGWKKIADINMTEENAKCPSGWLEETHSGIRYCRIY